MYLLLYVKGLIIGFSIAAPVGPIGVLCINRALNDGLRAGLMSGLGAACADAIFGMMAGFGLTFMSNFLIKEQMWIKLIGGAVLLLLGIKTLLERPPRQLVIHDRKINYLGAFATTFFLTLANPLSILAFIAVFAAFGIGTEHNDYWHAVSLVLGIGSGSLLWWLVLCSGLVYFLQKHVNQSRLYWVNLISGCIICVFGVIALLSSVTFFHFYLT